MLTRDSHRSKPDNKHAVDSNLRRVISYHDTKFGWPRFHTDEMYIKNTDRPKFIFMYYKTSYIGTLISREKWNIYNSFFSHDLCLIYHIDC